MINSLPAIGIGAETAVKAAEATQLVLPAGPTLNPTVMGVAQNTIAHTGSMLGNVLSAAAPILPVAGVCMLTYMGIRTLIGGPVWPINKIV